MKKQLILVFFVCASITVNAQQNINKQTKEITPGISFKSQTEKETSIKEQEARLKINLSDPTYPIDLLEKEKKQLKKSKKAIITTSKN